MSWWDGLAPSVHVADSCGSGLEVGHLASTKTTFSFCYTFCFVNYAHTYLSGQPQYMNQCGMAAFRKKAMN